MWQAVLRQETAQAGQTSIRRLSEKEMWQHIRVYNILVNQKNNIVFFLESRNQFYNLFDSISTLTHAVDTLTDNCIIGITANEERCQKLLLKHRLMKEKQLDVVLDPDAMTEAATKTRNTICLSRS